MDGGREEGKTMTKSEGKKEIRERGGGESRRAAPRMECGALRQNWSGCEKISPTNANVRARGRGDKITSLSLQHRPKKYVGEVS